VDANAAEVMAESGLHERARRCVERLASRVQHFVNDGWHCVRRSLIAGAGALALQYESANRRQRCLAAGNPCFRV
jgi:hypothetical protein